MVINQIFAPSRKISEALKACDKAIELDKILSKLILAKVIVIWLWGNLTRP